jgi:N-acetylmuramoyl-L-alanine amidase
LNLIFLFFLTIVSISASQTLQINEKQLIEEQHCLEKNIFYEAGNQSERGKVAVAYVTLNRMRSKTYPNTFCSVVYQRKQFSWTLNRHHESRTQKDKRWRESCRIAKQFRKYKDPTRGALFFHSKQVNPSWSCKRKRTISIGNHIFYK